MIQALGPDRQAWCLAPAGGALRDERMDRMQDLHSRCEDPPVRRRRGPCAGLSPSRHVRQATPCRAKQSQLGPAVHGRETRNSKLETRNKSEIRMAQTSKPIRGPVRQTNPILGPAGRKLSTRSRQTKPIGVENGVSACKTKDYGCLRVCGGRKNKANVRQDKLGKGGCT